MFGIQFIFMMILDKLFLVSLRPSVIFLFACFWGYNWRYSRLIPESVTPGWSCVMIGISGDRTQVNWKQCAPYPVYSPWVSFFKYLLSVLSNAIVAK